MNLEERISELELRVKELELNVEELKKQGNETAIEEREKTEIYAAEAVAKDTVIVKNVEETAQDTAIDNVVEEVSQDIAIDNVVEEVSQNIAIDNTVETVAQEAPIATTVEAGVNVVTSEEAANINNATVTVPNEPKVTKPVQTKATGGQYFNVGAEGTYTAGKASSDKAANNSNTARPASAPQANVRPIQPQVRKTVQAQAGTKPAQPQMSLENRIGKNVMGIAASVLILVAIILFAVRIYDVIGDIAKVIIMYAISIAITAIGLIKMRTSKKIVNFYTILAACGFGAIYISFLLTYFHFEMIPIYGLVVALSIWTISLAVLSRKTSVIFLYISYAGLVVSTIMCASKWTESPISLIFYLVSIVILFACNYKKEYEKNAFFFIQLPIVLAVLSLIYSDNNICLIVILLIEFAALILQNMFFDFNKLNEALLIPTTAITYLALLIGRFALSGIDENILNYIFSALFIAITVVYYFTHSKDRDKNPAYLVSYYMTTVFLLFIFNSNIWLLAIVLFTIGYVCNNSHFRYVSYGYIAFSGIICEDLLISTLIGDDGKVALLVLLLAVMVMFALMRMPRRYNIFDKLLLTILLFFLSFRLYSQDAISASVLFAVLAAFSICLNLKWYRTNPSTGEEEKEPIIPAYVVNGIMILAALQQIRHNFDPVIIGVEIPGSAVVTAILVILFGIGVVSINTKRLFEIKIPEITVGIYICAKFMLLLLAILARFEAPGYLKSIAALVMAVIAITLGFKLEHKSFRLYGLVLALICVVKLIIIDIDYNTTLLRPVGYLAAGALCLGISYTYNKLEKRNTTANSSEE